MPPKGKRRGSQRNCSSRNVTDHLEGSKTPAQPPKPPSTNKKRRVEFRNPIGRVLQPSCSNSNPTPSLGKGGGNQRETNPSIPTREQVAVHRNVRSPPVSRRQQHSDLPQERFEIANQNRDVDVPLARLRTADTIPEESDSDDRDVHVVKRQGLESNILYRRHFGSDTGEDQPRAVARTMFSPLTPNQAVEPDETVNTDRHLCFGNEHSLQNIIQPQDNSLLRTGHPAVHDDVVKFSVSRDILKTFYKDIESKMISELNSLRNFVSSKLQGIDTLEGKLLSHMNEFRVLLSVGRSVSGLQSRLTPLAKYEAKLDSATPNADWIFNSETLRRILRVNLSVFISSMATEQGDTLSNVSLAIRALLFGLLPSQKRALFSTGVGRKHSSFRFAVVMNILYNVQHNSFQKFLPAEQSEVILHRNWSNETEEREGRSNTNVRRTKEQIKQPNWLTKAFIRRKHVEEARVRLELNTTSTESGEVTGCQEQQKKIRISVKDTPDKDDIARYGALKVYRFVTTGLYQAREKSRWVLFEELTYIMTVWENEEVDTDQRTLQVRWADEHLDHAEVDLSTIPDCELRRKGIAMADEHNNNVLAEFLSSRREMVVFIAHEVKVKVGAPSSRQKRNTETRVLQRTINLIDVATKFCVIFSEQAVGGFSHLPFLGAHKDSLKCIHALALVFREIVEAFMEHYMENGSYVPPTGSTSATFEALGLQIEHLLPAASVRKRLLISRCLRMSDEEFEKLDMASAEPAVGNHNKADTADDVDIGVEDDGVMLL